MAKDYGDIPCVKWDSAIHITASSTECLCGQAWGYRNPRRMEISEKQNHYQNIIWRGIGAVTCVECKKKYLENRKEKPYEIE